MNPIKTAYRLFYRERYQRYEELMRRLSLGPEEVCALANERLRAILRYAVDHVPRYKGLRPQFDEAYPDASGEELLVLFPVATKSDIRDRRGQFLSDEFGSIRRARDQTGGTTGERHEFWHDYSCKMLGQASLLRSFSMMGCSPDDDALWVWFEKRRQRPVQKLKDVLRPLCSGKHLVNAAYMTEDAFPGIVDRVNRRGIRFLYGYVSGIYFIARWMIRKGLATPSVEAVMTSAERLEPEQRRVIGEAFGARVFSQYGSDEVAGLATECREGNMHVFTDMAHVEVSAKRAGDRGSFLVTNLHNRCMPFIRYQIGDVGRLLEGTCPCGLPFPLMGTDVGRTDEDFFLPSGGVVPAGYFTGLVFGMDGVARFQFVQRATGEVDLQVIRDDDFGSETERNLAALPDRVREDHGENVRTSVSYVRSIPLTVQGKYRFILSQASPAGGRG